MRGNFIYKMFEGELKPWGQRNTFSAEREKLNEKLTNEIRYFMERMSPEDNERFQEIEELDSQAAFEDEIDSFTQGFTLGTLLMIEIMTAKEALLNE